MILRDDKYKKERLDLLDSFIRLKNLRDRDSFPDDEWNLYIRDNGSTGLINYLRECENTEIEAKTRGVRI